MRPSIAIPLSLAGIAFLGLLTLVGIAANFFARDALLRDILTWAGRLWAGACGVAPLLIVVGAGYGVIQLCRWARVRAVLVHHKLGNLPAVADPRIRLIADNRNEKAEIAWAIFAGGVDRATGSGMRALIAPRPEDEILQLAEPGPLELEASAIIVPDPQRKPDTFVVGQKGSGKTNVLRYIINRYRQALPDAKFMILSTIASNWPGIDAITQPEAIVQALRDLHEEIETRDDTMKGAHISDYHRWSDAPPLIVVIVDEAESVVEKLSLLQPKLIKEFTSTLEIVVNTGRNFGMMFVVGTQTARTDVLDPSLLRNAGTLLMMRMDTATAARFAVYGPAITSMLPSMEPGRAYNPQSGGYVTFPLVERLRLPASAMLCRPQLRLPADAEADGLGDEDMPDGPVYRYDSPSNGGNGGGVSGIPVSVPQDVPPVEDDKRLIYQRWKALQSLKAVERELYGQEGGVKFYWVRDAVNEMRTRRGQAPI